MNYETLDDALERIQELEGKIEDLETTNEELVKALEEIKGLAEDQL